jgi:hypothetical protein
MHGEQELGDGVTELPQQAGRMGGLTCSRTTGTAQAE